MWCRLGLCLVVFLCTCIVNAQENIQASLLKLKSSIRYKEVDQFYRFSSYQLQWVGHPQRIKTLVAVLGESDSYGLRKEDYQNAFIKQIEQLTPNNLQDSFEYDIRLSDAAIHLFSELKSGNKKPALSYNGLHYSPDNSGVPMLVKTFLEQGKLEELVPYIQPKSVEFKHMTALLNKFNGRVRQAGFSESRITSSKVSLSNKPLLLRLYHLGVIDTPYLAEERLLPLKIREAQGYFDVLADGKLRSTTIAALNVPLKRRIAELELAMNWLRYMEGLRHKKILVLNIPSAMIYIYHNDSLVVSSKAVVGKSSTPTPTLSSTIMEVILYPYWHVPNKIAVKELLPRIKQNTGYLDANNFQVLNKQGRVVNPYSINWHALHAGYFPYTIRQSTGCDNSLGIVKFNFYNPYSVYLHDTPNKSLFTYNKRYYSHGCMRVEMYEDMAHLLLGSNRVAIDTLIAQGCLNQQAPITIEAEQSLPVMVIYSTLWYSKEGIIRFYDDIYKRLPSLLK